MSPDDFQQLMAAPASDETFEQVIALLRSTFDVPYYKSRGDVVRGSVAFATTPERRSRLIRVLSEGLQAALWRQPAQEVGPRPGLEANSVAVGAAAVALARLDARTEVDALAAAFSKIDQKQVHYELTQTTGVLAIALASLNAPMQPAIEQMLTIADGAWGPARSLREPTSVCPVGADVECLGSARLVE